MLYKIGYANAVLFSLSYHLLIPSPFLSTSCLIALAKQLLLLDD